MSQYSEFKEKFLDSIQESIKNIKSFKNLPMKLKKDPNFIAETLKLVHINEAYVGQYEELVPEIIKELDINKEVALILVKSHGYLLCRLPEHFKDDEDVILEAINSYAFSLNYASKKSKDNKKLALAAVKLKPDMLEVISKRLCEDKEVVLEAVKVDGKAVNYAPNLWSDKEVMLEAAKTNINVLQYLGQDLVGDKEIALAAYKCDKFAYQYFTKELKQEIIDKNIEDIASYLESSILADALQTELIESKIQIKKVKI
jgi:hypothetical protein